MVRQISVENFKCFSNEKTFRLVPLTILSGLNGAGKSSLIQALLMLKSSTSTRDNVVPDDIFPHKIGAISQLIAQDFVGERQITLSAQTDKGDWSFSYKLSGSSKQRLKVIGDPQQCPDPLPTIQYLNAERIGPRLNNGFGESEQLISPDGSNAAYLLNQAEQAGLLIPDNLRMKDEPQKLTYQVEKYLSAIVGLLELGYDVDLDNAFIKTTMRTPISSVPVTEPLTGFGFSYAFPIVVAGLLSTCHPGDTMLIIENPEAHLHPSAQSNMGKFLALIAGCGVQVLIETHSEHIIDGARLQMASEGKTEQLLIHFFGQSERCLTTRELTVNEKGELSSWPKGFFDQKQQDLRALLEMGRK